MGRNRNEETSLVVGGVGGRKKSFPDCSEGKESACNAGDPGSLLGQEDPLEKG